MSEIFIKNKFKLIFKLKRQAYWPESVSDEIAAAFKHSHVYVTCINLYTIIISRIYMRNIFDRNYIE